MIFPLVTGKNADDLWDEWEKKEVTQLEKQGTKISIFFTQLFLDTLLQAILLTLKLDYQPLYGKRARAPPPLFSGMTDRAAEVGPSVKWNTKRKPYTVFARKN